MTKQSRPQTTTSEYLERAVAVYHHAFVNDAAGKAYLAGIGITDASLLTQFKAGFCNGSFKAILPNDKAIQEELKQIGILNAQGEERLKDCVVFPVYGIDGEIKTIFGIQTASHVPVHLENGSTSLWNAGVLKTCSEIILVTSVIEALRLVMAGDHNVMAVQDGTGLCEADITDLAAYGSRFVVKAGRQDEGTMLADALSKAGILCCVEPSSETIEKAGEENTFQGSALPDPVPVVPPGRKRDDSQAGFTVAFDRRHYQIIGLEHGTRKLKATVRVESGGKLHVDTIDFYSARARKTLTQDICRVFNDIPEVIEADMTRLILACEDKLLQDTAQDESDLPGMTEYERKQAEILGRSLDLMDRILRDYHSIGLVGEDTNKLLGYIAMTSRKLSKPLSMLILSSSGAGKSALQDAITSFCPPEDLVKLTTLSGKALFYKGKDSLKHKVLAIEEGDGAEEATYAIRNLISSGVLVSESTIKDFSTGKLTTMENRVEGPTSVFLTTTNPNTDPETMSRFFVTGIDEGREQTRKILAYQRESHMQDNGCLEKEGIKTLHRNFQRLLQPISIRNPLAGRLTYGDDRLQSRRDQPKYLMLIKSVCFLRQMQKETKQDSNGPFIEVDADDIQIANRLANEVLGRSMDELSRPGRDLLVCLDGLVDQKTQELDEDHSRSDISFTRREIREFTGWANTRVHRYIKELTELEYVLTDSGKNGMKYRYRLAFEDQGSWSAHGLLCLSDLMAKAS